MQTRRVDWAAMGGGSQDAGVVAELLARRIPGHGLDAGFTTLSAVHALDLERIWRRSWLFAAHSAELARSGDLVVFDLGDDSLLIVRDRRGEVHAHHNSCRHRGTRLCVAPAEQLRQLVCPYHQWVYDLDGSLRACGGMDATGEVSDPTAHGLVPAPVREVGGLIFVALGAPPPFPDELGEALEPQGLSGARVAAVREYQIAADWKVVWENNRECWHCVHGHPQYVGANFDAVADTPDVRADADRRASALETRLAAIGARVDHHRPGLAPFPSPGRWWSVNRTPLRDGWVTESVDGRAVAPLMGAYTEPDAGTLRIRCLPNFWAHASSDHAVTTRLIPDGPGRTRARVTWLVDAAAREGVDYRLEDLLPFWELTSEQDWELCERVQAGMRDSAYRPGPYSRSREANVLAFIDWYVDQVGRTDG